MYRKMCEIEQLWIDKLMDVEFQGRDILLNQLKNAKIIYKQEYDFISIKFVIEGEVTPYPYHIRVPVEMRAYQKLTAPIVFLLHIINGVIEELEIFTADSTRIDVGCIELKKVEYEIDPKVSLPGKP